MSIEGGFIKLPKPDSRCQELFSLFLVPKKNGGTGPHSGELVSADLAPWPSIAPAPGLDMVSSTSPARGAGVGVH